MDRILTKSFYLMENLVFTQLSVTEVRKMLREEVQAVIKDIQLPQAVEEINELLSIQEVAKFINMAVPSVYGLVHFKKIPHIKRGKRLIFEKKQIIDWLQSGRQKTLQDIQAEADNYFRSHPKQ